LLKKLPPPASKKSPFPHCGRNPANPQNLPFFTFISCSVASAFKATLEALFEQKLPAFFTPAVIQEIRKNYRLYCYSGNEIPQIMAELPAQYRIDLRTIRWIYILFNTAEALREFRKPRAYYDSVVLNTLIEVFEKLQEPTFSQLNRVSKVFYVNLLSALTSRAVSNDNFEEIRRFAHREAIKTLTQFEEYYGDTFSLSLSSRAPS